MLDDQVEESKLKTYFKKAMKKMKKHSSPQKKTKEKNREKRMYQDIMTQIELESRYLFFFKEYNKIKYLYTLNKVTLYIQ